MEAAILRGNLTKQYFTADVEFDAEKKINIFHLPDGQTLESTSLFPNSVGDYTVFLIGGDKAHAQEIAGYMNNDDNHQPERWTMKEGRHVYLHLKYGEEE